MTSLSCRVVSGIVVSVRRSSVVVYEVKSGLVSESLIERKRLIIQAVRTFSARVRRNPVYCWKQTFGISL